MVGSEIRLVVEHRYRSCAVTNFGDPLRSVRLQHHAGYPVLGGRTFEANLLEEDLMDVPSSSSKGSGP